VKKAQISIPIMNPKWKLILLSQQFATNSKTWKISIQT
jgi:hypothetical protein